MTSKPLRRIPISDLNAHLTCFLCKGYLVDATTIIECLHSFCKSCIVRYLETSTYCPVCDAQVHKTKPLVSLREDRTLQDVVYKLVPGLFRREVEQRVQFYNENPNAVGDKTWHSLREKRHFFHVDDLISTSLEYIPPAHAHAHVLGLRPIKAHYATRGSSPENPPEGGKTSPDGGDACLNGETKVKTQAEIEEDRKRTEEEERSSHRRYLLCPASFTISYLEKFVRTKYRLSMHHKVDVMHAGDCLSPDLTLLDIVYQYKWNEDAPLKFFYTVVAPSTVPSRKRMKSGISNRTRPLMPNVADIKKKSPSPNSNKVLLNGNSQTKQEDSDRKKDSSVCVKRKMPLSPNSGSNTTNSSSANGGSESSPKRIKTETSTSSFNTKSILKHSPLKTINISDLTSPHEPTVPTSMETDTLTTKTTDTKTNDVEMKERDDVCDDSDNDGDNPNQTLDSLDSSRDDGEGRMVIDESAQSPSEDEDSKQDSEKSPSVSPEIPMITFSPKLMLNYNNSLNSHKTSPSSIKIKKEMSDAVVSPNKSTNNSNSKSSEKSDRPIVAGPHIPMVKIPKSSPMSNLSAKINLENNKPSSQKISQKSSDSKKHKHSSVPKPSKKKSPKHSGSSLANTALKVSTVDRNVMTSSNKLLVPPIKISKCHPDSNSADKNVTLMVTSPTDSLKNTFPKTSTTPTVNSVHKPVVPSVPKSVVEKKNSTQTLGNVNKSPPISKANLFLLSPTLSSPVKSTSAKTLTPPTTAIVTSSSHQKLTSSTPSSVRVSSAVTTAANKVPTTVNLNSVSSVSLTSPAGIINITPTSGDNNSTINSTKAETPNITLTAVTSMSSPNNVTHLPPAFSTNVGSVSPYLTSSATSDLVAAIRQQQERQQYFNFQQQQQMIQQLQQKQMKEKQEQLQQLQKLQQKSQLEQSMAAAAAAAAAAAVANARLPTAAVTSASQTSSNLVRSQYPPGLQFNQRPPFITPTKPRLGRPPNPNKVGTTAPKGIRGGRGSRGGVSGTRGRRGGASGTSRPSNPQQQSISSQLSQVAQQFPGPMAAASLMAMASSSAAAAGMMAGGSPTMIPGASPTGMLPGVSPTGLMPGSSPVELAKRVVEMTQFRNMFMLQQQQQQQQQNSAEMMSPHTQSQVTKPPPTVPNALNAILSGMTPASPNPHSPSYNVMASPNPYASSSPTPIPSSPQYNKQQQPIVTQNDTGTSLAAATPRTASAPQTAPSPRPARSPAPASPSAPTNNICSPTPEVTITKLPQQTNSTVTPKNTSTNTISITKRSGISITPATTSTEKTVTKTTNSSVRQIPNPSLLSNTKLKTSPSPKKVPTTENNSNLKQTSNNNAGEKPPNGITAVRSSPIKLERKNFEKKHKLSGNSPLKESGPLPDTSSISKIENLTRSLPTVTSSVTSAATNGLSKYS